MFNPNFSLFKNKFAIQARNTDLQDTIALISGDELSQQTHQLRKVLSDKSKYEGLKGNLPGVTFSTELITRAKSTKDKARLLEITERVKSYSGLCVLDFDNIDTDKVLSEVEKIPYTVLAFISPSGRGVKVVVSVKDIPQNETEFKAAYSKCVDTYSHIGEIDTSGSDCTRLCFVCEDKHIFINETAQGLIYDTSEVSIQDTPKQDTPIYHTTQSTNTDTDLSMLNYIDSDDYDTWLKVGMGIHSKGLPFSVWDKWSQKSSKYQDNNNGDMQSKWDGFTADKGVTFGTVVELAKGNGYKPTPIKTPTPQSDHLPQNTTQDNEICTTLPVEKTRIPMFSNYEGELFIGKFQSLYQAYADTHVWSPEMIMGMGIAGLSYVCGRNITVQTHIQAKQEYLNSYILAVGESDLTAKSEAIQEIKKHISHCYEDFSPVANALSLEGILKSLSENEESRQYLMLDESSVVFTNSRREGTKNLLSGLNELWLCPQNYRTVRAGEQTRIDYPYLNAWGNIPTQLIPAVFRQDDLISGTLNRWLPFFVSPKQKTERTPHAITEHYDKWIKHLKTQSERTEHRNLIFTTEADDKRYKWYDRLRQDAIQNGNQTGESRFHTHLVKLSGLFALSENKDNDNDVKIHHFDNALEVVRYLVECYEYLFKSIGGTRLGEIENKVLDILNTNGNEMTISLLAKKLQGYDSTERERIYEVLEKHGTIIRFKEKSNGRPVNKIRRIG